MDEVELVSKNSQRINYSLFSKHKHFQSKSNQLPETNKGSNVFRLNASKSRPISSNSNRSKNTDVSTNSLQNIFSENNIRLFKKSIIKSENDKKYRALREIIKKSNLNKIPERAFIYEKSFYDFKSVKKAVQMKRNKNKKQIFQSFSKNKTSGIFNVNLNSRGEAPNLCNRDIFRFKKLVKRIERKLLRDKKIKKESLLNFPFQNNLKYNISRRKGLLNIDINSIHDFLFKNNKKKADSEKRKKQIKDGKYKKRFKFKKRKKYKKKSRFASIESKVKGLMNQSLNNSENIYRNNSLCINRSKDDQSNSKFKYLTEVEIEKMKMDLQKLNESKALLRYFSSNFFLNEG